MVRHQAAGDGGSTFFIPPIVDQSTRSYGLKVELNAFVLHA